MRDPLGVKHTVKKKCLVDVYGGGITVQGNLAKERLPHGVSIPRASAVLEAGFVAVEMEYFSYESLISFFDFSSRASAARMIARVTDFLQFLMNKCTTAPLGTFVSHIER